MHMITVVCFNAHPLNLWRNPTTNLNKKYFSYKTHIFKYDYIFQNFQPFSSIIIDLCPLSVVWKAVIC